MPEQTAIEFLTGSTASPLTPETSKVMQNAPPSAPTTVGAIYGPPKVLSPSDTQASQFDYANRTQSDVPVDSESGVDAITRLRLSFQRDMQEQISVLQKKYGPDAVRLSTEGEPIVRVLDSDTGKPKDILVNEKGMSANDLMAIAGSVPEIAGSIIAMRMGKKSAALEKLFGGRASLRDIATTSVGAETAGAAKDVAARLGEGLNVNPGEIATERAKGMVLDAAFGGAIAGGAKVAKWIQSPLNGARGQMQFDALAAQKYFKETYGIDVPLSIGESTGSSLFQRAESMAEAMPGGKGPLVAQRNAQNQAFRDLQDILVGPKGDVPAEEVGRKVIDDLKSKLEGVKDAATGSRRVLASEGQQAVEGTINSLTSPQKQLYKEEIGNQIRTKVTEMRDAAKEESKVNYDAVHKLEGGTGNAFPVNTLAQEAQKTLEKLPSKVVVSEDSSPILGVSGKPAEIRSVTGEKVMKDFVPANVLGRLKEIASLKGNLSLSDLQQMRRQVYDDMEKGTGVPGMGNHYLSDIGGMLTRAIENGVESMPGGELKTALKAANKYYREKVVPFSDQGITEMFAKSNEPGFVGNFKLAAKFMSDPDAFIRLRDQLGANSPEFRNLKRGIADDVLENAKIPGTDQVNGQALINGIQALREKSRTVGEEVFGKDVSALTAYGRTIGLGTADKIDESLAQEIIATGKVNPTKIRAAVAAQRKADETFRNDIFASIAKGEQPTITADEFVGRFLDQTNPKGIREVMGALADRPDLLEEIRAKTIQKVFQDNARTSTAEQVGMALKGEKSQLVSALKIGDSLSKEGGLLRDKLVTILGPKGFDEFDKYVRLQLAPETKDLSFKGAGGLGASMAVSQAMRFGPLKYLDTAAKYFIESKFLTNPTARAMLSNVPGNQVDTLAHMLIVSTPFLEAATKEFGPDGAKALMVNIKKSMDQWGQEHSDKAGKPNSNPAPKGKSVAEFLSIPNTP